MRIPSGVVDQYLYFVAVDSTDLATRETGLSSFTVYRSREGGAAAAMTTPTINETDGTNMPGVYELLLDEDMTIGAGNDSEEMVFHITHAGMAPVTRVIELYRPKITAGYTLSVEADGDLTKVNALDGHTAQTGDAYAIVNSGTHGNAALKTLVDDVPTVTEFNARTLASADYTIVSDLGVIQTADHTANIAAILEDTSTTIPSTLATVAGYLDTEIAAILADTNELQSNQGSWVTATGFSTHSAADVADAVWDETIADHDGVGSTGASLSAAGGSGDPWSTALPGAYGAGTAGKIIGDNINAPIGTVDTVVDAIKAVTDALPDAGVLSSLAQASICTETRLSELDAATAGKMANQVDIIQTDTTTDIPGTITTAQNDLNILTGVDGVTLATLQANYAPNTVIPDAAGTTPTAAAIRAEIDSNSTQLAALVGRLTAARAGYLDNLNVTGVIAHSDAAGLYKADVSGLATAAALAAISTLIDSIIADTNELQTNQGNWLTATGFMPATEDGSAFTALNNISAADVWSEASARTVDFGTLLERLSDWHFNEKTVTDSTGAVVLRNKGDTADLATWGITDNATLTISTEVVWA